MTTQRAAFLEGEVCAGAFSLWTLFMWFPFGLWITEPLLSAGTIKCSKLFGRMLPGLKGGAIPWAG